MLNSWQSFLTTPLWLAYFAILEVTSLGQTSEVSPCIIVSQEQATNDQSDYQACAPVHEAIIRLLNFILDNTTHDNIIAFGTVMIAFFTLTLWWSTAKLWKAGERHSERELRAYVVIKNISMIDVEVGKAPGAHIIVTNSGKTPAYEVQQEAAIGLIDFPPPGRPEIPATDEPGSISVLGPGGEHRLTAHIKNVLSQDQLISLTNGTMAIHLLGSIKYRDAFGKARTTNFNAFHGGSFGIDPGGSPSMPTMETKPIKNAALPCRSQRQPALRAETDQGRLLVPLPPQRKRHIMIPQWPRSAQVGANSFRAVLSEPAGTSRSALATNRIGKAYSYGTVANPGRSRQARQAVIEQFSASSA
jgi:hypothetical protein